MIANQKTQVQKMIGQIFVHLNIILNQTRVRAVDRHCRKMRQKNKCGARFFHLAKVRGDNFLSRNLIQLTDFRQQ